MKFWSDSDKNLQVTLVTWRYIETNQPYNQATSKFLHQLFLSTICISDIGLINQNLTTRNPILTNIASVHRICLQSTELNCRIKLQVRLHCNLYQCLGYRSNFKQNITLNSTPTLKRIRYLVTHSGWRILLPYIRIF